MKKILLFLGFCILTSCATGRFVETSFLDYREYANEGFYISPDPYQGVCANLGEVDIFAEYVYADSVLALAVGKAKAINADGIVNVAIAAVRDKNNIIVGYTLHGLLIKREHPEELGNRYFPAYSRVFIPYQRQGNHAQNSKPVSESSAQSPYVEQHPRRSSDELDKVVLSDGTILKYPQDDTENGILSVVEKVEKDFDNNKRKAKIRQKAYENLLIIGDWHQYSGLKSEKIEGALNSLNELIQ